MLERTINMQNHIQEVAFANSISKYLQTADPYVKIELNEMLIENSSSLREKATENLIKARKDGKENDFFLQPFNQEEELKERIFSQDQNLYISETIQLIKDISILCVISAVLSLQEHDKTKVVNKSLNLLGKELKTIYSESACKEKTIEVFVSIATGSILNYTAICFHYDIYKSILSELDEYFSLSKQLFTSSSSQDESNILQEQMNAIENSYLTHFEMLKKYSSIENQLERLSEKVMKIVGINPTLDKDFVANVGNTEFHIIHQGVPTNQLNRLMDKPLKSEDELTINGTRRIESGDFVMHYANHEEIGKIKPSAKLLLDSLIITATKKHSKENKVFLPLKEYAAMRQKKLTKDFRKQVVQDLVSLSNIKIEYIEIIEGKSEKSGIIALFGGTAIIKNGIIEFNFNNDFFKTLINLPIMNYPSELLTFNLNTNPHSHNLLRRISEHRNMNYNKSNRDIIGVNTLLNSCPTLPTIEDLKKHEMQVTKRIITPFERDMNAIKCLSWEYCGKNGAVLKERPKKYSEFINCKVKITWHNYPARISK